jgi:GT2 family glycosyltransferase
MNNSKESQVAIIIVSWNTKSYLEKCLSSIFKQSYNNFNVIFVDNGSSDGSVEFVRSAFPGVYVIPLDKNYGFSKANNIGIDEAFKDKPRYIVLLNVDTVIEENFLKELVIARLE